MRDSTAVALAKFGQTPIRGVEIGVQFGRHALELNGNLNFSELVLCDIWEPYVSCGVPFDFSKAYEDVKEMFSPTKNVTVYKGTVDGVVGEFDFAYIDGNHSLPAVLHDLRTIYRRMKPGGILAGHDYSALGVEVALAVLGFASEKNLSLKLSWGTDTDWWFEV